MTTVDLFGCALTQINVFGRREIRELGMTLVINARKKPPPLHLYKALLMAQVKTISLHAHVWIYNARTHTDTQTHNQMQTDVSCHVLWFTDKEPDDRVSESSWKCSDTLSFQVCARWWWRETQEGVMPTFLNHVYRERGWTHCNTKIGLLYVSWEVWHPLLSSLHLNSQSKSVAYVELKLLF